MTFTDLTISGKPEKKSMLTLIFVVAFLDMLAVGTVIPLLPLYMRSLGISVEGVGWIGTAYGLVQLFGGPIMGRLSDSHGRRVVLLISFAGTCVGYGLLAVASNVWMIVLSRLPVGLVKQTVAVSQSVVGDVTHERDRASMLGYLGVFLGFGLVVGPIVGGQLMQLHKSLPAMCASSCYLFIIAVVSWFWKPVERTNLSDLEAQTEEPPAVKRVELRQVVGDFRRFASRELGKSNIRFLLLASFSITLASHLVSVTIPLELDEKFGLGSGQAGMVMSGLAATYAITQALLLPLLTSRWSEFTLISWLLPLLALCMLGMVFCTQVIMYIVFLTPAMITAALLQTCVISSLTKNASKGDTGGTIGLFQAVQSLTRATAPALAGVLITRLGYSGPWMAGCLPCVIVAFLLGGPQETRDTAVDRA